MITDLHIRTFLPYSFINRDLSVPPRMRSNDQAFSSYINKEIPHFLEFLVMIKILLKSFKRYISWEIRYLMKNENFTFNVSRATEWAANWFSFCNKSLYFAVSSLNCLFARSNSRDGTVSSNDFWRDVILYTDIS